MVRTFASLKDNTLQVGTSFVALERVCSRVTGFRICNAERGPRGRIISCHIPRFVYPQNLRHVLRFHEAENTSQNIHVKQFIPFKSARLSLELSFHVWKGFGSMENLFSTVLVSCCHVTQFPRLDIQDPKLRLCNNFENRIFRGQTWSTLVRNLVTVRKSRHFATVTEQVQTLQVQTALCPKPTSGSLKPRIYLSS